MPYLACSLTKGFIVRVNKKQSPTEINPAEGDTLDKFYQEEVKRLPTPRRNDDYMVSLVAIAEQVNKQASPFSFIPDGKPDGRSW